MKKRKILTKKDFKLMFIGIIVNLIFFWTFIHYSSKNSKLRAAEYRLVKNNFMENVEFQGDILKIEKYRRGRSQVSICFKLNKLKVDSSKIIEGNRFFNLDWNVTNLNFLGFDYNTEIRLKEMDEVHLNKNWNGKLMLYSVSGDSIDASSNFIGLANSERTEFCRDFID